MAGKLISCKNGPVYIQFDPRGQVLISRDDRPSAVLLSLSEWNWLCMCASLHGWPVSPPLGNVPDYSLTVEPWEDKEDAGH